MFVTRDVAVLVSLVLDELDDIMMPTGPTLPEPERTDSVKVARVDRVVSDKTGTHAVKVE